MKSPTVRSPVDPYENLSSWSADLVTITNPVRHWDIEALTAQMRQHLGHHHADAYPSELALGFPHILARIAALWGTKEMDDYFHSLMVSDRQNRQGFPAPVATEIFRLSMIHGERRPIQETTNIWSGNRTKF